MTAKTTTPDTLTLAGPATTINVALTLCRESKYVRVVNCEPVYRTTMFGNRRVCGVAVVVKITGSRAMRDLWIRALCTATGVAV